MDGARFDRLVRTLTTSASRRGTLTGLVAGLLAVLAPDADPVAARRRKTQKPAPHDKNLHAERKKRKKSNKGKKKGCARLGEACGDRACCGAENRCFQGTCITCLPGGAPAIDKEQCCRPTKLVDGVCCSGHGEACADDADCCVLQCYEGKCVGCFPAGAPLGSHGESVCCSGLARDGVCCESNVRCCGVLGDSCAKSHCCDEGLCFNGVCERCLPEGEATGDRFQCCTSWTFNGVCCGGRDGSCARSQCCEPPEGLITCIDDVCHTCRLEGAQVGDARFCCSLAVNDQGQCCAVKVDQSCAGSGCCGEGVCFDGTCVSCLPGGARPPGGDAGLCCSNKVRDGRCCGPLGPECCFTADDCPPGCYVCSVEDGACYPDLTDPTCCVASDDSAVKCEAHEECCDGKCVDYATDHENCGGCTSRDEGFACGPEQTCSNFDCVCPSGRDECGAFVCCDEGLVCCNGKCVTPAPEHCPACCLAPNRICTAAGCKKLCGGNLCTEQTCCFLPHQDPPFNGCCAPTATCCPNTIATDGAIGGCCDFTDGVCCDSWCCPAGTSCGAEVFTCN